MIGITYASVPLYRMFCQVCSCVASSLTIKLADATEQILHCTSLSAFRTRGTICSRATVSEQANIAALEQHDIKFDFVLAAGNRIWWDCS